jgi:hypothetical protein
LWLQFCVLEGFGSTCDEKVDGLFHQDKGMARHFLFQVIPSSFIEPMHAVVKRLSLSRPTILKEERVMLAVCSFTVDVAIRWQGIYWS